MIIFQGKRFIVSWVGLLASPNATPMIIFKENDLLSVGWGCQELENGDLHCPLYYADPSASIWQYRKGKRYELPSERGLGANGVFKLLGGENGA